MKNPIEIMFELTHWTMWKIGALSQSPRQYKSHNEPMNPEEFAKFSAVIFFEVIILMMLIACLICGVAKGLLT